VSTAYKLEGKNTLDFLIGDTSPNDLVGTVLEKKQFLPKKIPLEIRTNRHLVLTNEMEFDL